MSSTQMMFGGNLFSCLFTFVSLLEQGGFLEAAHFMFKHYDFAIHVLVLSVSCFCMIKSTYLTNNIIRLLVVFYLFFCCLFKHLFLNLNKISFYCLGILICSYFLIKSLKLYFYSFIMQYMVV